MAQNSASFMSNAMQTPTAYSPPKAAFGGGGVQSTAYPHAIIPAAQCLPATTATQQQPVLPPPPPQQQQVMLPAAVPPLQTIDKPVGDEKPQSNGTNAGSGGGGSMPVEVKEGQQNHVTSSPNVPAPSGKHNNAGGDKHDKHFPEPSVVPPISVASAATIKSISEKQKVDAPSPQKESVDLKTDIKEKEPLVKEKQPPLREPSVDKKTPEKSKMDGAKKVTEATSSTYPQKTEKDTKPEQNNTKSSPDKEDKVEKIDSDREKTEKKPEEKVQIEEAQSNTASAPSTPTTPQKPKEQSTPIKSPMKVATTPRTPQRRSRTPKGEETSPRASGMKSGEPKPSTSKSPASGKVKRARVRTQPYQSPLPELEIISKISQNTNTPKGNEGKLIVFFKNEFLAVRNSDGGFFVCQAMQNVYKSSSRIKIRWLSQEKGEKSGEIYTPDFYDSIDFECILTNLELSRVSKGKFRLPAKEHDRTDNILKRAIAVEKGEDIALDDSMTEDNPDGLDVSLYKEEEQLTKRKATKRKAAKRAAAKRVAEDSEDDDDLDGEDDDPPAKTPKKGRKPPAVVATPTSSEAPKRSTAAGRAERAKRRSGGDDIKTSPVIDNKKAKVLAKVVKRTATTPSPAKTKTTKAVETKTKPAVASTSKAKTPKAAPPTPVAPARKTPKRGRK